jgi:predicted NBD/HSP70 family sugar kinase
VHILNNLQVRNTNKKRIINYLYKNDGASKQDIINALRLSAPTVSLIMNDLSNRGLVKKAGTLKSSGGRKPAANSLVYNAKLSVGVEITNNHLRFVIIDLSENILYSKRLHEPFRNDVNYYQNLAKHIDTFLHESEVDRNKLLGVGIAVPGIVNAKNNILEYSPTLNVTNLPLNVITKFIPYPVMVNNEANLAGFTEIWKINDTEDAVYLSINKGVGGAIIIGNKLFYGLDGRSGEFGHVSIVKDGLICSCGKKGCFEAYCSTNVLTESSFDDIDDFFTTLEKGNQYCMRKWEIYLDHLATGINNIYTIFDSKIIIGGEISKYLEKYFDILQQKLVSLSTFVTRADYLHFSQFGDNASSTGAALILVDSFLND